MTRTAEVIPVDLKNPGQVLACMGFLEAAEVLCNHRKSPEVHLMPTIVRSAVVS